MTRGSKNSCSLLLSPVRSRSGSHVTVTKLSALPLNSLGLDMAPPPRHSGRSPRT